MRWAGVPAPGSRSPLVIHMTVIATAAIRTRAMPDLRTVLALLVDDLRADIPSVLGVTVTIAEAGDAGHPDLG